MFESEECVRNLLNNMTKKLLFGGFVILTFPDACTILKKVRERASKN